MRRLLAWGVHLYTASGALVGALALLAIGAGRWHAAVLLMLAAMAIDATDGMLARAVDVRRVLPGFDGRRLDDMADYLNFVIVPVVFLVATGLLPHWAWAAPPVIASAYGFSQVDAKTEDDFFLGWPSYWNVLAIYVWLLGFPAWLCVLLVAVFAALIFVPFKYVYPTKLRRFRRTTYVLALLCALLVAAAVAAPSLGRSLHLAEISLLFPIWYVGLSLHLGGLHRPDGG